MTSVAVVVLDTLRKDFFDEFFDWLPGRRFERAFSTANWTAPAHASLFTGLYPSESGVHAHAPSLDVPRPVLPERLRQAGYRTRCWTANPNLSRRRQWDRGFEEFVGAGRLLTGDRDELKTWDDFEAGTEEGGFWKYLEAVWSCVRDDCATIPSLRHGLRYLRSGPEGLRLVPDHGAQTVRNRARATDFGDTEFLVVNLMEAHTPYNPPVEFRTTDGPVTVTIRHSVGLTEPDADVRRAYRDAVRYLATIYRDLFEELYEAFDYVVTLADHGEMLGEEGVWNHTYGLFPQLTHVPLVISAPDIVGRSDATVNLLDLHRTLLDLAGLDPADGARGTNLLDDSGDGTRLTEYHGLIPIARERLDEDAEESLSYDEYLTGIAAPPSYYGHETGSGFEESGTAPTNPQCQMEALREGLDKRVVESSSESGLPRDRLEALGYV